MQPKLIPQTGLKVRTNCRLGYYSFVGPLTQAQSGNNKCIEERDIHSISCEGYGWPQNGGICEGNNNGKELDRCMAKVWGPLELKFFRSQGFGGGPYNSPLGDKCFNEFIGRYNDGWAIDKNKEEWEKCLATVP